MIEQGEAMRGEGGREGRGWDPEGRGRGGIENEGDGRLVAIIMLQHRSFFEY